MFLPVMIYLTSHYVLCINGICYEPVISDFFDMQSEIILQPLESILKFIINLLFVTLMIVKTAHEKVELVCKYTG
jgi:hypothetical protein